MKRDSLVSASRGAGLLRAAGCFVITAASFVITAFAQAPLSGAISVVSSLNANGNSFSCDSFNSTNAVLFPGGVYNASNRMDHGDIVILSTNSSLLTLGNTQIRGSIHTAPNWSASGANLGPSGSVGDNAWVGAGTPGIESGHALGDAIMQFPDVSLPGGVILLPAAAGSYMPGDGYTYKYFLTDSHFWIINSLNGGIYVNGTNVNVFLTGSSATIPSGTRIEVPNLSGANGNPYRLTMYVAATSFTVVGPGFVNDSGVARNLQYYGLSTNTLLSLDGNGSVTAQIYAPEAAFSLGGGGNNTYDFSGIIVSKSFNLNGHYNIHFDESLVQTAHSSAAATLSVSFQPASNQVQISVAGVTGLNYALQSSSNLSDWSSLATNTSPFIYQQSQASDLAPQFFRAVYLP